MPEHKLIRYWFACTPGYGIGITAYSRAKAEILANKIASDFKWKIMNVVENIDVSTLDQNHIIPNMGPPNFEGVWFPYLNLRDSHDLL